LINIELKDEIVNTGFFISRKERYGAANAKNKTIRIPSLYRCDLCVKPYTPVTRYL